MKITTRQNNELVKFFPFYMVLIN